MNKKGVLPLSWIVGLIIAGILLIAFLVSSQIRWVLFGVGIIIVGFMALDKLKSDKTKITVFLIAIAIGGFMVLGSGVLQEQFPSGEYVESPVFMYYECAPASQATTGPWEDVPEGGAWYDGPEDATVETYDMRLGIKEHSSAIVKVKYKICEENGDCESEKEYIFGDEDDTFKIDNLRNDQEVKVNFRNRRLLGLSYSNYGEGEIQYQYTPFILWKNSMFEGGRTEYSDKDKGCSFSYSERDNLIDSSTIDLENDDSNRLQELEPYETRNFIDSFVPVSTRNMNFVEYQGEDGYCRNSKVYSIETVETEGGDTYRVVNTDYNDVIDNVECCPGDTEPDRRCTDDFEWESTEQSECGPFNPCPSEKQPSGDEELVYYECVDGECVEETESVECTTDSVCVEEYGEGWSCDKKNWECVEGEVPEPGEGPDEPEKECEWYETYKEKEKCGLWCQLGLSGPTTEEGCYVSNWVYWAGGGLIVLILGTVAILVNTDNKSKRRPVRRARTSSRRRR